MEDILSQHEKKAELLFEAKRYSQSLDACLQALAIDPKSFTALEYGSLNLINLKRLDEAEQYCDALIANYPDEANAYFYKGQLFYQSNNFEEASKYIHYALEINPNSAQFHAFLAKVLYYQNKNQEALEAANQSLQLNPTEDDALSFKSLVLDNLNMKNELDENIKLTLQLYPNDPYVHTYIGIIKNNNKEYTAAKEHLKAALRANPNISIARNEMLKALKNEYWLYSILVTFHEWAMKNVFQKTFGFFIAFNVARFVPFLMPIFMVLMLIFILAIIAEPFLNVVLKFDSYGKYLLSKAQNLNIKINAGIMLALAVELLVYFLLYKEDRLLHISVSTFFLIVPVYKLMEYGFLSRTYNISFAVTLFLFLGQFVGFIQEGFGNVCLGLYAVSIFIWTIRG